MLSDLKNLLKHSSIYGISNLLQKGIGFLMIPVYTHYMTPADYGILELMDLTINIIAMLMGLRLGTAIIRYYHHYETQQDRDEVFSTALIFVLAVTPVVIGILELFTRSAAGLVLGSAQYWRYFQIIFVAMGYQIVATVPENYLLARKKSAVYSLVSIGTLISYLTLNILFVVVYRMGVLGMLLSMVITKSLNTSSLIIIMGRGRRIRYRFSWEKMKQMIKFGLPLVPESFCMFMIHYSDRFFVQRYCDLDQLGQYSLGYKFGMILSYLVAEPFFRIWNTQRFEIAKKDDAGRTFSIFLTYFVTLMIFCSLGISIFIDEVIMIMAPDEYQGATAVVALIVISYVFYGIANYLTLGIMITYRTQYAAYIQMAGAVLNLGFNMYFIMNYGVMGAAVSTALTFFTIAAFTFTASQRLYPVPYEYGRILTLFVLFGFIYALSQMIEMPFWSGLGVKCALVLMFPFLLYLLKFFNETEMEKGRELLSMGMQKFGLRKKHLETS